MFEYKPYIKSLINYMYRNGYTEKPFPKIILNNKKQSGLFIKTGAYIPEDKEILLYINQRHPKDVLRSLAHELIHHKQYIDGRLDYNKIGDSKIISDDYVVPFEEEAFLKGNMVFRAWTEKYNK